MIKYCDEVCCPELIDALESLAYRVLHYEHPTWYSIPEDEVVRLLKEEGIGAYVDEEC